MVEACLVAWMDELAVGTGTGGFVGLVEAHFFVPFRSYVLFG